MARRIRDFFHMSSPVCERSMRWLAWRGYSDELFSTRLLMKRLALRVRPARDHSRSPRLDLIEEFAAMTVGIEVAPRILTNHGDCSSEPIWHRSSVSLDAPVGSRDLGDCRPATCARDL